MSIYSEILDDFSEIGVDFRMNDLDDSIEVKWQGQWRMIDDALEGVFKMELRDMGYSGRKKPSFGAVTDAIRKRAHEKRYHPIKDYFDSLSIYVPRTSGPYAIPELAAYFNNPDGLFSRWLLRWMVGVVAKVYEQARNPMLVLVSEQTVGKSWFARWLCPIKDRFIEGQLKPDNKDSNLRLIDKLIWEVGELGATTRRQDVEATKNFITQTHISERPPYGKYPIYKPAVCSFIGSVNNDGSGFLTDPTGNSRFLTAEIVSIDFAYSKQLNIDFIWSEAVWLYRNVPKSWQLSPDEKRLQAEANRRFETTTALDEIIDLLVEVTNDPSDFITTMELRDFIAPHYRFSNETAFARELARSLYSRGVKPRRMAYQDSEQHRRGYMGLKKRSVTLE